LRTSDVIQHCPCHATVRGLYHRTGIAHCKHCVGIENENTSERVPLRQRICQNQPEAATAGVPITAETIVARIPRRHVTELIALSPLLEGASQFHLKRGTTG
jgi:hypothetical protein